MLDERKHSQQGDDDQAVVKTAARLPPQLLLRGERKQPGLRNALRKRRLLHRKVRSVRLLTCLPMFAGVFFRPEEYCLVSIVVNDVYTAECVPLDIGLEQ